MYQNVVRGLEHQVLLCGFDRGAVMMVGDDGFDGGF